MTQSLEAFGDPGQYPCYSNDPTYMKCGGWKLKLVYMNVTFPCFCVWSANSPFSDKSRLPEQDTFRIPDYIPVPWEQTTNLQLLFSKQLHLSA